MARHPGTPVGDLFPPGVAIFGAGGGQGQQAVAPASSQVVQPGEPEHFKKEDPLPPDQENPEHLEWIKRGHRYRRLVMAIHQNQARHSLRQFSCLTGSLQRSIRLEDTSSPSASIPEDYRHKRSAFPLSPGLS